MQQYKRTLKGVTLLEVMLVLAVSTALILMVLQRYNSYKRDSDLQTVERNVATIFGAMGRYYQANCANKNSQLYPTASGIPASFAVNWEDLKPYFPAQLMFSSFIDYTESPGPTSDPTPDPIPPPKPGPGYIVQFNLITSGPSDLPRRTVPVTSPPATGPVKTMGSIVMWQAQVAVKLLRAEDGLTLLPQLSANCLSTEDKNLVAPCGSAPNGGNFAVWASQPSFGMSTSNTLYWGSTPIIKQFTQMYTTYPILSLLALPNDKAARDQYFVCGS